MYRRVPLDPSRMDEAVRGNAHVDLNATGSRAVSIRGVSAFEELTLNSPPAHRRAFAQMPRGRSLTVGKGTMRTA